MHVKTIYPAPVVFPGKKDRVYMLIVMFPACVFKLVVVLNGEED